MDKLSFSEPPLGAEVPTESQPSSTADLLQMFSQASEQKRNHTLAPPPPPAKKTHSMRRASQVRSRLFSDRHIGTIPALSLVTRSKSKKGGKGYKGGQGSYLKHLSLHSKPTPEEAVEEMMSLSLSDRKTVRHVSFSGKS